MRFVVPTLLAAAALAAPAVATAAPLAPVQKLSGFETGPALRGDQVLYATSVKGKAFTLQQQPIAGGAATTLFSQSMPLKGDDLYGMGIRASATRVALGATEAQAVDPDGFTNYSVVRSGEGLQDVVAGDLDGNEHVAGFDLDGDVLVHVSKFQAYVRDLAAGTPAQRIGPEGARTVKVAGPYVAVGRVGEKSAEVIVYDRATATETYRVAVPITQPYAFGFDLDLQADGTVAVLQANPASTGGVPKQDLAWASVADPKLHVIATDVDAYVLRLAADRVLFIRAKGRSKELAIATLTGEVRPASFPVDHIVGADFDGSRIAMATVRCLYVGDAAEPAAAEPPAGPCTQTVLLTEAPLTATTKGVRAAVGCRQGPAAGCTGTLRLRSGRVGRQAPLTLAARTFAAPVGAAASALLTPSRTVLRKLRAATRRKAVTVTVAATGKDASGRTVRSERHVSLRIR